MAEITILDVGHGNSAILRDSSGNVIIDGGSSKQTLLQHIKNEGINEIDVVLVSHADEDHIGGILDLLHDPDIIIGNLYVNSDIRRTKIWRNFRIALADARKRGLQLRTELTTTQPAQLDRGAIKLEILSPEPEIALGGASGEDLNGMTLTANAMSVIVRIVSEAKPEILLTGDMDSSTLDKLLSSGISLAAAVLVFPHHGGLPGGSDPSEFARNLCEAVHPELVVFSIGRDKHENPQTAIINSVMTAAPHAHIACTQLSQLCAANLPSVAPDYLVYDKARGHYDMKCCAGDIVIFLGTDALSYKPTRNEHCAFIESAAPSAICRCVTG